MVHVGKDETIVSNNRRCRRRRSCSSTQTVAKLQWYNISFTCYVTSGWSWCVHDLYICVYETNSQHDKRLFHQTRALRLQNIIRNTSSYGLPLYLHIMYNNRLMFGSNMRYVYGTGKF